MERSGSRSVDILSLSVIRGVSAAVFTISIPFLNIYLYERGFSMSLIGFVSGVSTFLGSSMRIFSGGLSDIISPARVIFYGIFLRSLALLSVAFLIWIEADILLFAPAIFLNSAAFSLIINGSNSLLSYSIKDDIKRIMAISKVRVGINLGFSIGPIIGGFISHYWSYMLLFVFSGIVSFLVLPLVQKLNNSELEARNQSVSIRDYFSDMFLPLKSKLFLLVSFSTFFSALVFSQFINTLPVYAAHYSIDKRMIGYLFTTNGLTVILMQLWITRVSSKMFGNFVSALLGILIYASSFVMFGISQNFVWLVFSVFYMTLGEMLLIPSLMNTAMKISPENKKGVFLGFFEFFETVGWALGKYVGGLVFDFFVHKPIYMWSILSGLTVFPFLCIFITMLQENSIRRAKRRYINK